MKKLLPIIILFLVSLLAFFPAFLGRIPLNARNLVSFFTPWYYEKFSGFPVGVPAKPGMLDQIRIYYPYMQLTQDAYRAGELPLWNPYNFMGNPHMAEWQSGAFYPLHMLLPFLSLPVYWTFYQILGFFLAGLFTYLFLRNLKLGVIPSLLGGTTYMLSSFMTTWNMEVVTAPHSILWLPLILLSIDKIAVERKAESGKRKARWWCVGLASLVFSILSGYWQTTLYVMGISFIYALYRLSTGIFGRDLIFARKSAVTPEPRSHALREREAGSLRREASVLWGILLWFPLSLGLTAFHLLPTAELYERSGRPILNASPEIQEILKSYLLPVRHLVTLFAPDYFGHPTTRNYFANVGGGTYYEHVLFIGTIQLLLVLIAITAGGWVRARKQDIVFWTVLSAFAASFSFDTPWARWVFDVKLPVLSTGIANRIFFVNQFGMAILAAFGMEFIRKFMVRSSPRPPSLRSGVAGGSFIVPIVAVVMSIIVLIGVTYQNRSSLGAYDPTMFPENYKTSLRNLVIPTGVFVLGSMLLVIPNLLGNLYQNRFRVERGMTIVLSGLLTLTLLQNLYQHYKFTAFSEMQFVYPPHSTLTWLQQNAGFNRFLGYNGQYLNNNFATAYRIFSVDGYDSLNDFRRSQLIHSAITGNITDLPPRSADATLSTDFWNQRTLRLMQLFGVKYLVDHPEWLDVLPSMERHRLPEEKERLVYQDRDWKIFEYLGALPRAFLVGNYEVVEDGQSTIDRLYANDFDPRNSVLLAPGSAALLSAPISQDPDSSVEIVSITPNSMTLTINSLTDQLLFISDTFYPGWQAKLENGTKLPILTANYALRAIPVPAGDHTVRMWYVPESFKRGIAISIVTLLAVSFVELRRRFRTSV